MTVHFQASTYVSTHKTYAPQAGFHGSAYLPLGSAKRGTLRHECAAGGRAWLRSQRPLRGHRGGHAAPPKPPVRLGRPSAPGPVRSEKRLARSGRGRGACAFSPSRPRSWGRGGAFPPRPWVPSGRVGGPRCPSRGGLHIRLPRTRPSQANGPCSFPNVVASGDRHRLYDSWRLAQTHHALEGRSCPATKTLTSDSLRALEGRSGRGLSTGRYRLRESKKQGQTRRN